MVNKVLGVRLIVIFIAFNNVKKGLVLLVFMREKREYKNVLIIKMNLYILYFERQMQHAWKHKLEEEIRVMSLFSLQVEPDIGWSLKTVTDPGFLNRGGRPYCIRICFAYGKKITCQSH